MRMTWPRFVLFSPVVASSSAASTLRNDQPTPNRGATNPSIHFAKDSVRHLRPSCSASSDGTPEVARTSVQELAGPRLRMERKPRLGFDDAKSSERPCGRNGRSGPVIEGNAL